MVMDARRWVLEDEFFKLIFELKVVMVLHRVTQSPKFRMFYF